METIFNEYYNLRSLGRGGFARVFKAKHISLGYVRAVKVSREIITGENDKAWQTFLNECKVLLKIGNGGHPNIVRIYQPRLIGNNAIVEMDYIEGESLNEYIRLSHKFLPIEEFWKFVSGIVGALAYCHVDMYKFQMDPVADNLDLDPEDGSKYIVPAGREEELIAKYCVVHNDLHSGNIMRRDYDGEYILLDFGLAKQGDHFVKSSSRNDGAREYCSPEKFDPDKRPTPASDVYSLGVLLYEMLTGDVPFREPSEGSPEYKASALEYAHRHADPPSMFEARKIAYEKAFPSKYYQRDFPEELERIIRKCLAKRPEERYKNAKELLVALTSLYSSIDEKEILKRENVKLKNELNVCVSEKAKTTAMLEEERYFSSLAKKQKEDADRMLEEEKNKHDEATGKINGWKRKMIWLPLLAALIGFAAAFIIFNRPGSGSDYSNRGKLADNPTYGEGGSEYPELSAQGEVLNSRGETILVRDTVRIESSTGQVVTVRDTIRVDVPRTNTETKIDYRTPPEVEAEVRRLNMQVKQLQEQLDNKEHELLDAKKGQGKTDVVTL